MRFTASLPMTTDRGLAGNLPRHHWDQSFLEVDQYPVDNTLPPATNTSRRKSEDAGNWNGGTLELVSFDQGPIPQSPSSMAPGRTVDCKVKAFRTDNSGVLSDFRIPGLRFCRSPDDPHHQHHQHIYQNGGIIQLDDASSGADDVLVDSVSRLTINSACFFFPVIHAPRTPTASIPRSTVPWLTLTPSGSETDTEGSRSQSISSQDSNEQDNNNVGVLTRIRDDSGIGMMTWCGEVLPRRNSSAPTLNELNVVVCRPSPSPIVEFPHEPLTVSSSAHHPTHAASVAPAKGVDNTIEEEEVDDNDDGSRVSSLLTVDEPGHDAYMRVARFLPSWDLERLSLVFHRLNVCRFYLGKLTFEDAKVLLRVYPVGTFLLRDSSDSRYLFSLSVQTTRGTTSIRVVYEAGHFRLDCEPEQLHLMPTFDCVIRLIQHYIRLASAFSRRGLRNNFVFLESSGRKDTPVLLRMPYANRALSLKHLCRLRINGILGNQSVDRLQLIPSLKTFLRDYPYNI